MKVDLVQILEKLFAPYQINVNVIKKPYTDLELYDLQMYSNNINLEKQIKQFIKNIPMNTLLLAKDHFSVEYALFILPETYDCVIIGPFRYGKYFSFDENKYDYDQETNEKLKEYLLSIPYVEENLVSVNLGSIVSTIYPKNKFEIKYYVENQPLSIIHKKVSDEKKIKTQKESMKEIERRYDVENQFLQAVSKGDATLASIMMKKMYSPEIASRFIFSQLQQRKSIIILNTLLRKAIEHGKVHPYYIDEISSRYAKKAELISNDQEFTDLMASMIHEYCEYVHKYSHMNYSLSIQKVIQYIDMNISKEITLLELSEYVNLSPTYLSSQFRNEIGITIINYINSKKMDKAAYMLRNSQSSVSYIAESIGIYDLNYFSRLFKKYFNCTPTEYRKSSIK